MKITHCNHDADAVLCADCVGKNRLVYLESEVTRLRALCLRLADALEKGAECADIREENALIAEARAGRGEGVTAETNERIREAMDSARYGEGES